MAKYLDQTGAQHFAEAIMGSTKTINGQPIWGSGNIEAGDGGNIITLKSAADFDTYSSLLADDGYKVVIFAFNSVTLSDKTYTIRNAKIYANYNDGGFNKIN